MGVRSRPMRSHAKFSARLQSVPASSSNAAKREIGPMPAQLMMTLRRPPGSTASAASLSRYPGENHRCLEWSARSVAVVRPTPLLLPMYPLVAVYDAS